MDSSVAPSCEWTEEESELMERLSVRCIKEAVEAKLGRVALHYIRNDDGYFIAAEASARTGQLALFKKFWKKTESTNVAYSILQAVIFGGSVEILVFLFGEGGIDKGLLKYHAMTIVLMAMNAIRAEKKTEFKKYEEMVEILKTLPKEEELAMDNALGRYEVIKEEEKEAIQKMEAR